MLDVEEKTVLRDGQVTRTTRISTPKQGPFLNLLAAHFGVRAERARAWNNRCRVPASHPPSSALFPPLPAPNAR